MVNKKIKSDNSYHRKLMFDVLKDIFDSKIKHDIALKWWTLCMFLYGLDRFSVDLDFDIINAKASLSEIKNITKKKLEKYWKIIQETNTKLILKYNDNQIPLKLEFNTRFYKYNVYSVENLFGISISTMTKDCIFSNKLVALSERKQKNNKIASRDLYDIRFFFKNKRPINDDLIIERTWRTTKSYLESLIPFISINFNRENILRWLGELVSEKQKFFIKNKLINEVLSQIDFYIRNDNK